MMNLTRYLYNFLEVKHSLFLSILRHNKDDTLFWLCEIFYSGYEEDLNEFLLKMYNECFCKTAVLKEYVKKYKRKIKSTVETTRLLAYSTFAVTLCNHDYDMVKFVKDYFKVDCVQKDSHSNCNNVVVEIKKEDLIQYKTVQKERPYQVLKDACKLPIHKEYSKLFMINFLDYSESKKQLQESWLYYCSETPIWIERMVLCNAIKIEDKKDIVFEDDDKMDKFYDQFNYEPDEQPVSVIDKLIGKSHLSQKTLDQFCDEFHLEPSKKAVFNNEKKQHSYFVIKSIEVLQEWISSSHELNVQEWKEDGITLSYTNDYYLDFPVTNLQGEYVWTMEWKEIEQLLYNKWENQFNMIDEKLEENVKMLEDSKEYIHVVFAFQNKLIGFDIIYNNQKISKKKVEYLKKMGVTNYYTVSGEWVLSQSKIPDILPCKRIL